MRMCGLMRPRAREEHLLAAKRRFSAQQAATVEECDALSIEARRLAITGHYSRILVRGTGGLDDLLVAQVIRKLLERRLSEFGVLPEGRLEVSVQDLEGEERGLGEVAQTHGHAAGLREAVGDAGVGQDLLRNGGCHDAGTTGRRHQADVHRAALAVDLVGHRVGKTCAAEESKREGEREREEMMIMPFEDVVGNKELELEYDTCNSAFKRERQRHKRELRLTPPQKYMKGH